DLGGANQPVGVVRRFDPWKLLFAGGEALLAAVGHHRDPAPLLRAEGASVVRAPRTEPDDSYANFGHDRVPRYSLAAVPSRLPSQRCPGTLLRAALPFTGRGEGAPLERAGAPA